MTDEIKAKIDRIASAYPNPCGFRQNISAINSVIKSRSSPLQLRFSSLLLLYILPKTSKNPE